MAIALPLTSAQEEALLASLHPRAAALARELKKRCEEEGFSIQIVRGLRSYEEQEHLYASGRSREGSIVTRRRGGDSFHNYGVAFDIYPAAASEAERLERYRQAGAIGKALGFEWGGDWEGFVDMPHFHYSLGHSIRDFKHGRVKWNAYA